MTIPASQASPWWRIAIGFVVAVMSAATLLAGVGALFAPRLEATPLEAALHFGVYGGMLSAIIVVVLGLPLYLVTRLLNLPIKRAALLTGLLLPVTCLALLALQNDASLIPFWIYPLLALVGVVCAMVFCAVSGVSRRAA